jgi:hypothetical protein
MSRTGVSTLSQRDDPPVERRSGADRRSGQDRRAVDVLTQMGRPGFELRTGVERRSGRDRRRTDALEGTEGIDVPMPDVVLAWHIAERGPKTRPNQAFGLCCPSPEGRSLGG